MRILVRTLIVGLAAPIAACGDKRSLDIPPPLGIEITAPAQVQGVRTGNGLACTVHITARVGGGLASDFVRWDSGTVEWKYATASSVISFGPISLDRAAMAQIFGGAQLQSGATQVAQFSATSGSGSPPILTMTLNYDFKFTFSGGQLASSAGVVQCQ